MAINRKLILNYGVILLFGLGAGWLLRSYTINSAVEATQTLAGETLGEPTEIFSGMSEQANTIPSLANDTSNSNTIETEQWSIEQLIDTIRHWGLGEVFTKRVLVKSLVSNPELMHKLLDEYLDIADEQTRRNARYLLRQSRGIKGGAEIDAEILYRMRNGNRSREWLNALGKIGTFDSELIQYLSDELPLYYENGDVAAAIEALSLLGPNWYADSYSPDLTKNITRQISQHLDSTDPAIRRAAIASLSKYPQNETSSILLDAISDPSEQIRETALRVLSFNDLRSSDEIKPTILAVMNDDSEKFAIRELAWMALDGVHLSGDEQSQFLNFFHLRKNQQ